MLKPAIFTFFLTASLSTAQVITTVAGASWLPPISGTAPLGAGLGGPSGVAFDASGNMYIADSVANVVERVSGGILTVIAGNGKAAFAGDGGPAVNASLNIPWSVAVDASGNVYIADAGNNRIRIVSNGIINTFAGNGAQGYAGDGGPALNAEFYTPVGVAVDSGGNVYVADTGNNRIRKISGGTITTLAGTGANDFTGNGGPATAAALANPEGVAVDAAGNIYIADSYNCQIRKVTSGVITTFAGSDACGYTGDGGPATSATLYIPLGVTVDANNNVYIADTGNFAIRKVSGGVITTVAGNQNVSAPAGDGGAALSAFIDNVYGLATDASLNLYIAQYYEGRIRKISGGVINTVVGNGQGGFAGDGGPAVAALFDHPTRAAMDAAGNLYIADTNNNRVRKVSGGVVTTVAGNGAAGYSGDGGPATGASLNRPWGVAVDAAGNLYIADDNNQRVRKVSSGIITTFAGDGQQAYSGDGGPAVSAALSNPIGVAVDASGNVYIADGSNNRIRKVSNGAITTVAGNGAAGYAGDGGLATRASLNGPYDVTVDSAGNLYIADAGNDVIRKVSGTTITTVAGNGASGYSGDGGAAANAKLNDPTGVAVDARGDLYIADTFNNVIRMVSGGRIVTVAGDGAQFYSGDGGPATSASLDLPQGAVLDSAGNLYVLDTSDNRTRAVLAAPVPIQAAPTSLSFTGAASGTVSAPQGVTLASSAPGLPFSVSTSASWITVSTTSASAPAVIEVSADPTNLTAGSYSGTMTIVAPNATPSAISINVSFTVSAAAPPKLSVGAPGVTFTAPQGSSPVTQTLQVLNAGSGPLPFTVAQAAGASWLSFTAQSTSATPGSPATLTLTAAPGSLTPGTYSGSITVAGAGSTVTVPVTLSVSSPAGTLLISQNALTFNAVAQGGNPLPQSFSILNTGSGALNWTASANTLSGGNWLQISPVSGGVAQPFLSASPVNASVNSSGMPPGVYYGRILIASSGAVNTPQSLTIILNVLPAGTKMGPQVYPTGLIFTGVAGESPSSQNVMVANMGSSANSYVSSAIGPVSFLPADAVVQPSQPTTLYVYPDFTKLGSGITRGTITLQFSDGSPAQTINVLMSAAPPGGTADAVKAKGQLAPRTAACATQGLSVVFRSPQPSANFAATVGGSVTLEAAVSDGCGNAVIPGSNNPKVIADFSNNDPQLSLSYIGGNSWQVAWKPVNAASNVTATVSAVEVVATALVGGQASVYGAVTQPSTASPAPLVTAQGVVHAASDAGGIPIAPGELISVYGSNLASGAAGNSSLPLPVNSNGTEVLLGTTALPILYTSAGQMNVQVPYSAPVNTTYQLSVQNGSTLSVPQTLTVALASPGIFTTNEQGFGQGAILKSDGVTLAQAGTPASIGEVVTIYCTGLGPTTPPATEGQPAPTSPLAQTANTTTVSIGGQPAQVQFSGLTPGFAGLYQVNAVVPSGIATGNSVPVTVTVAGQTSQAGVTMAVH